MARKIDVRRILEEKIKGSSNNSIASNWGISKHSIKEAVEKATELGILPGGPIPDMTDDEQYSLIFPDRRDSADIHQPVDFADVHSVFGAILVSGPLHSCRQDCSAVMFCKLLIFPGQDNLSFMWMMLHSGQKIIAYNHT